MVRIFDQQHVTLDNYDKEFWFVFSPLVRFMSRARVRVSVGSEREAQLRVQVQSSKGSVQSFTVAH